MLTNLVSGGITRARMALSHGRGAYMMSLAASQLAPLVSAPIVSRLYSPEEFGVYGLYFGIVAILASVSSLALHNSIVLEEVGRRALHAVTLSFATLIAFSVSLFLLIFLFDGDLLSKLVGSDTYAVIYFLPLSVFLSGTLMCLTSWAIRNNRFGLLARNKIALSITTAFLQVACGLWDLGSIGFVLANMAGVLLAVLLFVAPIGRQWRDIAFSPSIAAARRLLAQRKSIVYWMLPANLVSSITSFMPELVIGKLFGVALLGQYVLANRMVSFPVAFISSGIQDIFRHQAVSEFQSTGKSRKSFWRFLMILLVIAVMVLGPVILISPYVFPKLFGSQWGDAGALIQAVSFLTLARFVSSPLSYIWIIHDHQRLDLLWQIGLSALSFATLLLPPLLVPNITLYSTLFLYSVVVGAWYVLSVFVSHFLSGGARSSPDKPAGV